MLGRRLKRIMEDSHFTVYGPPKIAETCTNSTVTASVCEPPPPQKKILWTCQNARTGSQHLCTSEVKSWSSHFTVYITSQAACLYTSPRELEARKSCKQVEVITEAQCSRRGQVLLLWFLFFCFFRTIANFLCCG